MAGFAYADDKAPSPQDVAVYKQDIKRIEDYLNGITTFVAAFTQTDDQGEQNYGTFYLSRPGKLRWEHDSPHKLIIIVKGSLLTYYDYELDEVSHVSLDDDLSVFLTRSHISFDDEEIRVLRFDKSDDEISITIAKNGREDEGTLTMVFSNKKIELRGIRVFDAIGKNTKVDFSTVVYDKPLDPKLFTLSNSERKNRR